MTKEEIAKLVGEIPKGMDANDFLVELVNRALKSRTCPPCHHDCMEGRDCPARRNDNENRFSSNDHRNNLSFGSK